MSTSFHSELPAKGCFSFSLGRFHSLASDPVGRHSQKAVSSRSLGTNHHHSRKENSYGNQISSIPV
ncbi:unnamed protein product [Brassica oleracea]|uniref:(rape) hypothetical protein n=1 Tax=Brassica napus TaxID=3708 RepID=A0A816JSG7_BRANA|nr:unnamed protein product [Brassica napus]